MTEHSHIAGTETGRAPTSPNLEEVKRAPNWPSCPNCQQSMTGKYRKAHGCARCGIVETGFRVRGLLSVTA